ncbi:MAG: WG repeat-containing protein [Bacteroides sp.]|nr:WG repeat-containing protein [Bacteroides sp.]MCM1379694.1 WG repeat-containing protein [Bacteroides sp.]MCM1446049.1 WG repeat-containing protein [Prevotella sp.]
MKTIKLLMPVLALSLGIGSAVADLTPQSNGKKWGYVNESGTVVIPYTYAAAEPFVNGMAKVQKGKKWGYIDENGNPKIAAAYDEIGDFNNDIALVKKGAKYGYIRSNGVILIDPEYDFIGTPNADGYVWVAKGKTLAAAAKGLYRGNKCIVPVSNFTTLSFFLDTDSVDFRMGYPYTNASLPNEIKYNFSMLTSPEVPYVYASTGSKNALYDLDGKCVAPLSDVRYGAPVNGVSMYVKPGSKSGKYNYYNVETGRALLKKDVEIKFTDMKEKSIYSYPFRGGFGACPWNEGKYQLVDTSGEPVGSIYTWLSPVAAMGGYVVSDGSNYGAITNQAAQLIPMNFKQIVTPRTDAGAELLVAKDHNDKLGYINFRGETVIPFIYDAADHFRHGKGYIKKDGKWGMIDASNKVLIQPLYKSVLYSKNATDTHAWVQDFDDKYYLHSLSTGARVLPTAFTDCTNFDAKGRAAAMTDEKAGVIAMDGSIIVPFRFESMDIARQALSALDADGKTVMTEIDAYRFNTKLNPKRNSFGIYQVIDEDIWDF